MSLADVGKVLAKAAAFDGRKLSEAQAMAWFEVVGDLELADCLEAVTEHHANSDAYLMPVHIRRIVEAKVRRRREVESHNAAVAAIEALDATPLRNRSADVEKLIRRLRDSLPDVSADEVFRRPEWRAADKERERAQRPTEPNPLYAGPPPPGGWPVPGETQRPPLQWSEHLPLTDDDGTFTGYIPRAIAEQAPRERCANEAHHEPHCWRPAPLAPISLCVSPI